MATFFFDRQHAGKVRRPTDRGAWADLDHNGRADLEEQEALKTPLIAYSAEVRSIQLGHYVYIISHGEYKERHAWVNNFCRNHPDRGPFAYAALHLNSLIGGKPSEKSGKYGMVGYKQGSPQNMGYKLARFVAKRLQAKAPELSKVITPDVAPRGPWRNAHYTIGGLDPNIVAAICYEPCFLDQSKHTRLVQAAGLYELGRALAEGFDAWAKIIGDRKVA